MAGFFVLRSGPRRTGLCVQTDEIHRADSVASGTIRPKEPVEFYQFMGSRPYDVVRTTSVSFDLISQRFRDVLEQGRFTGWRTFTTRIRTKKLGVLENYYGLAVTGRCGPIVAERARIERRPPPVPWGNSYEAAIGLYIDESSWDGKDFFLPAFTTVTLVTERVAEAIRAAKLTNVRVTPAEEYESPGDPYGELEESRRQWEQWRARRRKRV